MDSRFTHFQEVVAPDELQFGLLNVSSEIEAGASRTREVVETGRRNVLRRLAVDKECVAVLGHRQWRRQHVRSDSLALLVCDALWLHVRHDPVEEVL